MGCASSDYAGVVSKHSGAPGPYHATSNALSVIAGRAAFVFGLTGRRESIRGRGGERREGHEGFKKEDDERKGGRGEKG